MNRQRHGSCTTLGRPLARWPAADCQVAGPLGASTLPPAGSNGKNAAAVALGRMGGKARAKGMTAKRRKEIAKKAAKTRWAETLPLIGTAPKFECFDCFQAGSAR